MDTQSNNVCVLVQTLPYKLSSDSFVEVVMVRERAAIVYTHHQEEHGATDRQIPGWREKELIPDTAFNHMQAGAHK